MLNPDYADCPGFERKRLFTTVGFRIAGHTTAAASDGKTAIKTARNAQPIGCFLYRPAVICNLEVAYNE